LWSLSSSRSAKWISTGDDRDPDGGPITAQLESGPSNGRVTLAADGSFAYRPHASFEETDSFTYTASDGLSVSAPATVQIEVDRRPGS
jgi:hypothetical protein